MPHRRSQQTEVVARTQRSQAGHQAARAAERTRRQGATRRQAEGVTAPPPTPRPHRSPPAPSPQIPARVIPPLPTLPLRLTLDDVLRGLTELGAGGGSVVLSPELGGEILRRLRESRDMARNCGIDPEGIDPILAASVEQLTASATQRRGMLPVVRAAVDRLRGFLEAEAEPPPPAPEGVPEEVWVIALEAGQTIARSEYARTQTAIGQALRATEVLAKVDRADAATLDSLARLRAFAGGGADHETAHTATGSFLDQLNQRAVEIAVEGKVVVRTGGRRNGG